jgi:hypothetical protein
MKRPFYSFLLVAAFLICMAEMQAPAAPVLIIGSLVTVNNTTAYSSTNACFTYSPTLQQFTIPHGALTATNALVLNIQVSTDQVNFTNAFTWYPTTTNAATEYIYAGAVPVTNYFRVQCVTTNSVQVGGNYGQ